MKNAPRIAIAANTSWYIYTFRFSLIKRLQEEGHEVCIVAPEDDYSALLKEAHCSCFFISLDNQGTNPFRELRTILAFRQLYASAQPSLALHYTPKPNIYGSLAARTLGIPCLNNISGLGTAFIRNGWLSHLVRLLYNVSQRHAAKVFFQNPDDLELFTGSGLVRKDKSELLPGSGVDLDWFAPRSRAAPSNGKTIFLLIARLIWDKGVGEFADAARMITAKHPEAELQLLGFIDSNNPSAVPVERIRAWEEEGILSWLGRSDDVRPNIAGADCVVLPSYREGTPRSLLEAASMARPVITTDAVGCRQVVDHGQTGFLCRPRSSEDLARTMERFLHLSDDERQAMGNKGRAKMLREFDERIVIDKYLEAISQALPTLSR